MLHIIIFFICLTASALGSVAGFGGGVIIKPALDAMAILPVSEITFLSGCTVLAMSASSLIRTRKNGPKLDIPTTLPMAIGAACGGVSGKLCLGYIKSICASESTLGLAQTVLLLLLNIAVLIYSLNSSKTKAKPCASIAVSVITGIGLGLASSFLGIGGGPYNVAVLNYLYSMDMKRSVKSSLLIILISQIASLFLGLFTNSVPLPMHWGYLALMTAGGVGGALTGAIISRKAADRDVKRVYTGVVMFIILLNLMNIIRFAFFNL